MSSALTEITFWLCGSGYSPAHRGKPSTTFVIAAQPPWVAMCSITIADITPSLTTRVLWGVIPYGELNAVTGAKATTRSPFFSREVKILERAETMVDGPTRSERPWEDVTRQSGPCNVVLLPFSDVFLGTARSARTHDWIQQL